MTLAYLGSDPRCAPPPRIGVLDGIPGDVILHFPKLTKLVRTLNEDPRIKEWNAEKNPKLPWC
jgi:hypothetical protein